MDAKMLAETAMLPKNRTLLQVNISSNLEADKIFVELMGKDPAQRYDFIIHSADLAVAEELDI